MVKLDADWFKTKLDEFISSPENTLKNEGNDPAWGTPLFGFSSGADPLYEFYKQDIGVFYRSPLELMEAEYPGVSFRPEQLTVVSYVLPHTDLTKEAHRNEKTWPSERWARARIMGEEANRKLRMHLVNSLKADGFRSISPIHSPLFHDALSEKYSFASTWSERHAAFAAGLGTFGLSDGLITAVGKAHRVGSVIVDAALPPSPRIYTNHNAYCLWYANSTCGACIQKCPAGAISEKGHDKQKCSDYVERTWAYVEEHYHFKGYGCGLCQVSIPCESCIPKGILR
jgi:epoxyqueuosine reductase